MLLRENEKSRKLCWLRLFFFMYRPSETRSHLVSFQFIVDSKTDSKTGRQQWIFMDGSGHAIGFWSGWKTLCDFTQFFAASALIKLPQRFSNEHKVGNDKEEILRTLPS